jgi:hypothetical protein
VVVATTRPWPAASISIDELLPQVRALGGELILADGHGDGWDPAVGSDVIWVRKPGWDRLHLHREALAMATGDVIAFTEDHVRPTPSWCEAIITSHREHADADAISGAVTNASRSHSFERASFLFTSAPYLPPITGRPDRSPPANNFSLKRRAVSTDLAPGDVELVVLPELYEDGRMVIDDRIVIEHVQPVSAREALVMHFHNGRTHGGTFVDEPRVNKRILTRAGLRIPGRVTRETKEAIKARPESGYPKRDVYAVRAIGLAHLTGFLVGITRGRGNSPGKIT